MLRKFNASALPAPQFYSHAAEASGAERIVFVSGQIGAMADGTIADGIDNQTRRAVANLKAVLAEAGMNFADIAKFTFYLTDPANFDGFAQNAVDLIQSPPAATTLVYVKALAAPNMLVEIEAIAVK
jgi:2-iminobutanoate/2-iminopropanoate deaminase